MLMRSAISHVARHARRVASMKHVPANLASIPNQPWRNLSMWRPALPRSPSFTLPRRGPLVLTRSASGGGGAGGTGGGYSGGGGTGGEDGSMGGAAGLWALYLSLLETKPLITKAITAGLLNMLGDVLAQVCIERSSVHDWHRTMVLTIVGTLLIGPTLHVWYNLLSRVPFTGNTGALARMALDQFCFAPFFLSAIIGSIITLEGHPEQVVPKLKADLFTVLKANWYLWIPFMFLNFRVIPLNLQAVASNVMALLWNVYMSFVTHAKVAEAPPPVETKLARRR